MDGFGDMVYLDVGSGQVLGSKIASGFGMNLLDQLKARLKAALARFATRKAQEQAEGMANEARGIVASTQDLARRNPLGLAALIGLGALLLWLMASRRQVDTA